MTTAHRPTFDPAKGKDAAAGPAYHQRLQPAHTTLKHRQAGQGTSGETQTRNLRAELLKAEAAYYAIKNKTGSANGTDTGTIEGATTDGRVAIPAQITDEQNDDDPEIVERRLALQAAVELDRDLDSDSSTGSHSSESESESDEDEEDETAALMRELAKIKEERAEKAAKEQAEKQLKEDDSRMMDIARGNPLLNQPSSSDFGVKRRWDDDVVFRNQARGTDDRNKPKEFVNDLLRSDFHKRFMSKYVR